LSRDLSRRDFLKQSGGAFALGALGLEATTFLAACANARSSTTSANSAVKPVKGGTFIESLTTDLTTLNPIKSVGGLDQIAYTLLFDSLLVSDGAGQLQPQLASALPKSSSDGLTHTFTLRPNMKWTDGQPLTSADVVFTYRLMYDASYKEFVSPYRGDVSTYLAQVDAPDQHTVVFRLKKPYSPFLALHGTHGILPQHVLGSLTAAQLNTAAFNNAPNVSSGPFKFVEWKSGDHLTFARNDGYYNGAAYLDQYVLQIFGTVAAVADALQTGAIDMGRITTASLVPALKAKPDLTVLIGDSPTVLRYLYQLDPAKPAGRIFSEKAVRQALLYAVDRQGLVDAVYANGLNAAVAKSMWSPGSWAYNPNTTPQYTYDKAKAAQMLEDAGWKKGADGIRAKNGVNLQFEITSTSSANEYKADAQVMQQNWNDIGASVSVKLLNYSQMVNVAIGSRDFDVVFYALSNSLDPDESIFWSSASAAPGGQNSMPYKNPQLDALLEQAATISDQAKRKQLYFQAQNLLADDLPAAPLVAQKNIQVYNNRVHGVNEKTFTGWTAFGPRAFMKDVFKTH
jgi:peptide/nickel transport system substrate-binding protein